MQQRFLSIINDLSHSPVLSGLWLMHSDEPLMSQWLIDAARPSWQAHSQIIKRIDLNSSKQWQDVINELSALSLFAESTALIVTGKHKPDKETLAALETFAADAQAGNNQNHLLWLLPKQDKKSQTTKAFKLFDTQGTVIDGTVFNESHRQELLAIQAKKLNLQLDREAWHILMGHTEHDLLSAYQTLLRLSFAHTASDQSTPTPINAELLMALLADGGSFSVFDLSDALIHQDLTQSLKILHHLRQTETAPSIILWAIHKDIQLVAELQAGKDPQSLGIWRNKITAYQNLARRLDPVMISALTALCYEIDKSIKGLSDDNIWRQLDHAIISICGINFSFYDFYHNFLS